MSQLSIHGRVTPQEGHVATVHLLPHLCKIKRVMAPRLLGGLGGYDEKEDICPLPQCLSPTKHSKKKKKKVSVLIICIDGHPHHHQQVLRASYEPSQRLQIQKKLNTVLATETLMGWFISRLNIISKLQDLVRANKMT